MENPEFWGFGSRGGRLAPGAAAGCHGTGLWVSWERAEHSIRVQVRQRPKSGISRYISLYEPVWGVPFWGCTPQLPRALSPSSEGVRQNPGYVEVAKCDELSSGTGRGGLRDRTKI